MTQVPSPMADGSNPEPSVSHTIHFQRRETPYAAARVRVPSEADTAKQIRRLESLGYTILDVSPPIAGYAPPSPYAASTGDD